MPYFILYKTGLPYPERNHERYKACYRFYVNDETFPNSGIMNRPDCLFVMHMTNFDHFSEAIIVKNFFNALNVKLREDQTSLGPIQNILVLCPNLRYDTPTVHLFQSYDRVPVDLMRKALLVIGYDNNLMAEIKECTQRINYSIPCIVWEYVKCI